MEAAFGGIFMLLGIQSERPSRIWLVNETFLLPLRIPLVVSMISHTSWMSLHPSGESLSMFAEDVLNVARRSIVLLSRRNGSCNQHQAYDKALQTLVRIEPVFWRDARIMVNY